MHREPSRREKREQKLIYAAEHGNFEVEVFLFSGEAKNLVKKGFSVDRKGNDRKKSLPSLVSFSNPFKTGLPPIVSDYIAGQIETFPKVSNWAQELYVIAARVNNKKVGQKTNE